jgi:uncharacterized membrane protein
MAGIGFELRKMIREDGDLLTRVRGYASAGLFAAGPWLMTITTLSLVGALGPLFLRRSEYEPFRAVVTYCFAFSLITVGLVQMCFTRRIADLIYTKEFSRVLPAFGTACVWVAVFQTITAAFFSYWVELPFAIGLVGTLLYVCISLSWISLMWLSATKDHALVLRAYGVGSVISVVLMILLGFDLFGVPQLRGVVGLLLGFTIGQGVILVLAVVGIVREFDLGGAPDPTILNSLRRYPRLALVGLFWNAAIWMDQLVFWFMDGVSVYPAINYHPMYDTCRFFSYLTVTPALALNLVLVETDFYDRYRDFYGSILRDFPLKEVQRRKQEMLRTLGDGTLRLLRVQGAVTFACLVFAGPLTRFLGLPPEAIGSFRACCLGSFFHVILLVTVLVMLYFDLRSSTVAVTFVFLAANLGLAFWDLERGPSAYGTGYAIAALLSLGTGYFLLARRSKVLEFLAFANHAGPAPEPKLEEEAEEEQEKQAA